MQSLEPRAIETPATKKSLGRLSLDGGLHAARRRRKGVRMRRAETVPFLGKPFRSRLQQLPLNIDEFLALFHVTNSPEVYQCQC